MPRISDDFLHGCIYLYPSEQDARDGTKTGGSGFIVGVPLENAPDRSVLYAVSNRHVVENGNSTIRMNTVDGKIAILDFSERDWIFHPAGDDLAICKLPSLEVVNVESKQLQENLHFITKALIDELNIGPGDDVFVIGRFINQEGRQKNQPTVRFGNLAQMPPEVVTQQRGMRVFEQESFIVEAKSIGGYSGSAVFVGMNPTLVRPERGMLVSNRLLLLGIGWGYISDWEPVCDASGRPMPGGQKVKANTGMMAVVPAWKLAEMLNTEEMLAAHKKADEEIVKARNPA